MSEPPTALVNALRACREAEREQAAFYRALATAAEDTGEALLAERLQDLHADEQHHLSRLTSRLMELGHSPGGSDRARVTVPPLPEWEAAAQRREDEEVLRYQALLGLGDMDAQTERLAREILDTERNHARELGGKWMPA